MNGLWVVAFVILIVAMVYENELINFEEWVRND